MEDMTYEKALAELEKTVAEIEDPAFPLEAVMEKVQRSMKLLDFCRKTLQKTEEEIDSAVRPEKE